MKTQIQARIGLIVGLALTLALVGALAPRAGAAVSATGGNYTNDIPGYRIHVYTNSATASNFVVSAASPGDTVQVLVVGGGGAGGGVNNGGGGGAGGFIYSNGYSVVAGSNYTVTVGVGGPANAGTTPVAGSNSVFDTITATGGGGGGGGNGGQGGGVGGSGGGGAYGNGPKGTRTPSPVQGNDGDVGVNSDPWPAGGGGGAGAPASGPQGGAGTNCSITGYSVWYAGGGSGGRNSTVVAGGQGGGGNGAGNSPSNIPATAGQPNTGGGGGGCQTSSSTGGGGGSGIVIVRYPYSPNPWAYAMPISFTNDARLNTLTNFPALVIFDTSKVNYSQFQANGQDLRFMDGTGVELAYEVESWDTSSNSTIWVQIPTLTAGCVITAYWGNASAVFPSYRTNGMVWAGGFALVEHMAISNGTTVADATTNRSTATIYNEYGYTPTGMIGPALNLSRTADRNNGLQLANSVSIGNNWAISCWFNGLLGTGDWRTLARGPTGNHQVLVEDTGTGLGSYMGGFSQYGSATLPTDSNWRHIMVVGSAGTSAAYVNGQLIGTGSFQSTEAVKSIGYLYTGSQKFASYLDEVRIDIVARSSNWVWACYANQSAPAAFSTYGAVSSAAGSTYKLQMAFTNYTRAEVLTNFPVLVTFSNGLYGTFNYNTFTAPASGGDLRFMDSTETTYLDFEIEKWATNDASYVWVRVPQLSSNTTIYAKWGGSDTNLPACTTNGAVWDSTFAAVWHLKDGTTLTAKDSTTNGYTATTNGTVTAVTGRVDGAADFQNPTEATANYLATTFDPSTRLGNNLTIRALVYPRTAVNYRGVAGDHNASPNSGLVFMQYESGAWRSGAGLGGSVWANSASYSLTPNSWSDVSAVYSNSAGTQYITGYKDGVYQNQGATVGSITHRTAFAIGRAFNGSNRYFDGIVDELRVSSVARSANWVWAEYANMASNAFFNGYSTVIAPTTATAPPQIQNQPPTGVMTNGATFNGKLVTNGFENAAVYVAWGQTNGAVSGSWATTNWWNPGDWTNGSYPSTNLTLAANANYYYRFGATNSMTNVVASGYQYLITGEVTVQTTDPTGRVNLADTAAFTVYRPASCTNEALTVAYTLNGTATNGVNYTNSPAATGTNGTVTIPAGQTNAVVTVYPLNLGAPEQTVVLTLASGGYAIGLANSATCTLAAATTWPAGSNRYWVAAGPGNWNNAANWSYAPYAPGGWSVPVSTNVAIFYGAGFGNCAMDAAVNVAGIVLTNGYAGTVTQASSTPITVGVSGWAQSAGTFTGSTNSITLNGPWRLAGGTFNAGNQTIKLGNAAGSWTYSGGAFNAGASTVSAFAGNSDITFSGSQTFNNLTLNGVFNTWWATYTVPTGTTLTVTNTLSLYDGSSDNKGFTFAGTGTIAAQGNISATYMRPNNAYAGPVLLLINGTGDQAFTNGGASITRIEINKPGGTLSLAGTFTVGNDANNAGLWTYTAGALNPGTSTISFSGETGGLTISGSHTLGNVTFFNVGGTHGNTITIAAGTTLTAAGTLAFNATGGGSTIPINTGTLCAQGDVTFSMGAACNGSAAFTFTGAATQQVSYSGTANNFQLKPVTVNKTGGAVTLATDLSLGASGQQLVWTNGAINLSSNTLTVAGATTIHPGATTLGVSVVDSNKAGRLTCNSAVSSITNVTLEMTVAATEAQMSGQTYMVLTNTAVLSSPFESVSWPGLWVGDVSYASGGGKMVTVSNIRQQALGDAPTIVNQPVTAVTSGGATFNGRLISNGTYSATVFVLWGETNGAVSGPWAYTNSWSQGAWPDSSYPSTNLTLAAGRNYYYTFGAANPGGQTIAPDQQYLITGDLTVQATDPTGRGPGNDTAAFTVYRPATCTNEALAVNYTLGGTAATPADYTIAPVSGAVILAKGQTNGVITVTPVFKESLAQTVVLTLAPGAYAIGAQNSATCTLATVAGTNRYWVAAAPGNWSDTNNWSFLSGQPGGYSVPGSGSIAFFDNGGAGHCTIDAAVNVAGVRLTNGYAGTVTQGSPAPITVGASGWGQSAGTFTGSTNSITLNGSWNLSGGTFSAGNQTITVVGTAVDRSWAYSGGTFNPGGSTVSFAAGSSIITISGSQTFNNLTLNGVYQTWWATYTVPTGTTLTVTNTLSLLDGNAANVGFAFAGTGTIAAQGNITASYLRAGNAYYGTVLLLINGAGDQTFTNGGATLTRIAINKPSGTLSLAGTHVVAGTGSDSGSWTYTAGTVNAGASSISFAGGGGGLTISGSHTLNNVTFFNVGPTFVNTVTIASGTTLTAAGTLTFNAASGNSAIPINTGIVNAQGDVNFSMGTVCSGTAFFHFSGGATQQVSYAGTPNYFQLSPVTVNKTGGAVTLATDLSLGTSGQQLVWTNGAVNLSSNTLMVAGAVTILPGATTLGVTVADTNKAGRLTCSSAVTNIAHVGLVVNVAATEAQVLGQTYTIVSNANVLGAEFESVTWLDGWRGAVAYTANGGKNVTLSSIGMPQGSVFRFR